MVQSVARATHILDSIANAGGAAHLNDIAAASGLKPTTAHNILKTLQEVGYVRRRAGDTRYHLGNRILNLARVAGDDAALCQHLRPALEAIAVKTGETVFLAVPSGDEVYFLDAIESTRPLKAASQRGQREPMAGSAIGLLFLAFIPALRKRMFETHADRIGGCLSGKVDAICDQGYALDQENWMPGLNCVAIPWADEGEIRAGIGLTGPSTRLTTTKLTEAATFMLEMVSHIGAPRS